MKPSDPKFAFVLFCLANIAISFNFAALAAAVPVISHDLGTSDVIVSTISAYYMIPYGLGALLYVPLSSRVSFKVILGGCMALYAVMSVLSAAVSSINIILITRILSGLAAASIVPLCLIAIGLNFPKEMRGRLVGLFFSTSFISSVLGLIVSGMCHWRSLFVIPGILAAVSAVLLFCSSGKVLERTDPVKVDYRNAWRNKKLRNVLLYIFALSFLFHGVHKWLGVYLHRFYNLDQLAISFYFILIALFGAIGQNIGGYVTDKYGRYLACYWGVLVLALATGLLVGKYPFWVLGCILAAFSVGWTIGHNGISTVMTDFPDEARAEVAALNSSVRFFSGGLGFLIGGPFVERNFGLTYLAFGVAMFIASFFLKYIVPQSRQKGGEHVEFER